MTTNNAGGPYNDETQKHAIQEGLDDLYPEGSPGWGVGKDREPNKRDTLFEMQEHLCAEALRLMKMKNCDYGAINDPFANFRKRGATGIMTRLDDKIARLDSFLEKGHLKLQSESIKDTVIDGINYLAILYAFLVDTGVIDHE